jgi:transposase InsO family protein
VTSSSSTEPPITTGPIAPDRPPSNTVSRRFSRRAAIGAFTFLLRREGWHINQKVIRRIYRALGLQLRNKTPKRRVKPVKRLKNDGFWVRGADFKFHEFSETNADDFVVGDLRDQGFCRAVVDRRFDEVYQLAVKNGPGVRIASQPIVCTRNPTLVGVSPDAINVVSVQNCWGK